MAISDDIKLTKGFANQGVHAVILLARTLFELMEEPGRFVRDHGITHTQYNVLRILQGSRNGLPHHEIRERLVANDSDVSRILDKLVRDGYAKRQRSDTDKRVVFGKITRKGLKLCEKLDGPLHSMHEAQFKGLGKKKTMQLVALLEELRANQRD